jgi:hypothetical protein
VISIFRGMLFFLLAGNLIGAEEDVQLEAVFYHRAG